MGFTFQVTGGGYGGFYTRFTRVSWRICLGWLAVTLFFIDIEPMLVAWAKELRLPK